MAWTPEQQRAYNRAYYLVNREKLLDYQHRYGQANREKIAERTRAYREANAERIKARKRAAYAAKRDTILPERRAKKAADPGRERAQQRAWYTANRDRIRAKQHGITLEEYRSLMERGTCAICGGRPKRLVVDHSHSTGVVRDALCDPCNVGLGNFGDDPERLRRAAEYLIHHAAHLRPPNANEPRMTSTG